MLKLYEYDTVIGNLLDQMAELDEIPDELYGELLDLKAERDVKIENVALYIKNLSAELKAVSEEEKKLKSRRIALTKKIDHMKMYLGNFVGEGNNHKTARVSIYWQRSKAVEFTDENKIPAIYRTPQPDKISKSDIKRAIEGGEDVPGAEIIVNHNIVVR